MTKASRSVAQDRLDIPPAQGEAGGNARPLGCARSDLYARDGQRPRSLEAAFERKSDLIFGNQTMVRLEYMIELRRMRKELARDLGRADQVVLLSYRPGSEEAGPEKSFDLSASGLAQRWLAGRLDMQEAERLRAAFAQEDLLVVRRKVS